MGAWLKIFAVVYRQSKDFSPETLANILEAIIDTILYTIIPAMFHIIKQSP